MDETYSDPLQRAIQARNAIAAHDRESSYKRKRKLIRKALYYAGWAIEDDPSCLPLSLVENIARTHQDYFDDGDAGRVLRKCRSHWSKQSSDILAMEAVEVPIDGGLLEIGDPNVSVANRELKDCISSGARSYVSLDDGRYLLELRLASSLPGLHGEEAQESTFSSIPIVIGTTGTIAAGDHLSLAHMPPGDVASLDVGKGKYEVCVSTIADHTIVVALTDTELDFDRNHPTIPRVNWLCEDFDE